MKINLFCGISNLLSLIPTEFGILLRRIWYKTTLKKCGSHLTVDFLAAIRRRDAEIGNYVTLGRASWVGWVSIEDNVKTGDSVAILSGRHQHFDPPEIKKIHIGENSWIGSHAVIMEDVAPQTIIGAGAVVTKKFPPNSIIAKVPAEVIK